MKTSRKQIVNKIKNVGGEIFTVTFIKKDGSFREMNCRKGVSKGVKGVGLSFDPKKYDLICVFDMQADGFRMINTKTIIAASIDGKKYEVK